MKIVFTFLVGIQFVILTGCGKKNSELILGKWKIEDATFPQPDFSQVPDSLQENYKKQLEVQNNLLLTTGYYEFEKGGVCWFTLAEDRSEGKWRLSDDQKKLFTKEKMGTEEQAFEIKELTRNLLEIESKFKNETIRFVMKKEVK